jgi:hypothetical protein
MRLSLMILMMMSLEKIIYAGLKTPFCQSEVRTSIFTYTLMNMYMYEHTYIVYYKYMYVNTHI